jgi:hypothetical protein
MLYISSARNVDMCTGAQWSVAARVDAADLKKL